MSPAALGALIGGAFGVVNLIVLRVADGLTKKAQSPEQHRAAGLIKALAWADLVVFPAVGYLIGPMVG